MLLQVQDGEPRTIGYWCRGLNPAERHYSVTERECLCVVWAVGTLRPYIEGTLFSVRTDHNSLNWLISLQDPAGRLARWRILLSEFDYSIDYRHGRVHQVPDALSRVPTTGLDETRLEDDIPCLVATQHDTELLGFVGETEPWDPWFAIGEDPFWNPLLV